MFNHNWITLPALIWFLSCCLNLGIYGQSHVAIGAHRLYQKTSFSCAGRPAGYYADIETGCQVYHMCDGLGRQFSYSCPNTTLFQQRMLICDHWYMVNCSKAESDYKANLLIGQRDQPFVNDEANYLRTPRPDLLDRPYAPDYSGESFRNQYSKQLAPAQNQIDDINAQKTLAKGSDNGPVAPATGGAQRWKLPTPPSRLILPPAYEPQVETAERTNVRFVSKTTTTATAPTNRRTGQYYNSRNNPTTTTTTSRKPQPTTTTTRRPTTRRQQQQQQQQQQQYYNNAALHQRQQQEVGHSDNDDLGTSHSTRYNTSADFNSAELPPAKQKNYYNQNNGRQFYKPAPTVTTTLPTTTTYRNYNPTTTTTIATTAGTTQRPYSQLGFSVTKANVKVPSKIYEPPFLYPIYNQNDTAVNSVTGSSSSSTYRTSTATPFTRAPTTLTTNRQRTQQTTTFATTRTPFTRPTTVAGRPFTLSTYAAPTTTTLAATTNNLGRQQNSLLQQRYENQKFSKDTRTTSAAQGFTPPTPRPPVPTTTTRATTTTHAATSRQETLAPATQRYNKPSPFLATSNNGNVQVEVPSNDLLPPYTDFVQHDIATTQGPPIYYEWKVPSNGLEPPKLDPPIGVDGREYPETIIDYNSLSGSASSNIALPSASTSAFGIDQQSTNNKEAAILGTDKNPFFTATPKDSQATRTAISRSIKDTAQPKNLIAGEKQQQSKQVETTANPIAAANTDINELRKELSVPEFLFPLENIGRTGYLAPESYNSFQLKIPVRRSDTDTGDEAEHLHWFGENPKCPECHPSYVVPGTCEPCLRR